MAGGLRDRAAAFLMAWIPRSFARCLAFKRKRIFHAHYTSTHLRVQAYHPIRFSGFRRVIVSTLVSSVAVAVQAVPVEVAVQVVPVAVVAMEMCNRRSG